MLTFTIIESPYAARPGSIGLTKAMEVLRHLEYARAAMADCFARGEIPLASHALYTQPGVLADDNSEQRRQGMEAGFTLRRVLGVTAHLSDLGETIVVQTACYEDLGLTPGMQTGLARSVDDGVPVIFRRLGGGWS